LVDLSPLVVIFTSGIVLGGIYAVVAIGLSIIWSVTKVLNFAHGSMFTWSGYAWLFTMSFTGNYVLASLVAILFGFVLATGVEIGIVRPLMKRPNWELLTLVALLAFSIFLDRLAIVTWGARTKLIPPFVTGVIDITPVVTIGFHDIIVVTIGVLALAVLWFFLVKSKVGMALRAVPMDQEGCALVGIKVEKMYVYSFGIGGMMAGLAAILLGSILFIDPFVGIIPLLKAFVVVVIGGIGSLKGTVYAAFILGISETAAAVFLGMSWAAPFLFLLMILVLIVRPRGLFGLDE